MSRKFQCRAVPSIWIEHNFRRLDCGPYVSGAIEAKELLSHMSATPLNELTAGHKGGIYNGSPFVRNYVEDPDYGVPFITTTSLLQADLNNLSLLSKRDAHSRQLSFLEIKPGMTLITCSGSIGRMAYARSDMAGVWSNQDIMKVVPDPNLIKPGYLYAYLCSRFGVPLIVSGTYGAIIQHIEPQHISDLPVPRLGEVEDQAHELIQRAAGLRTDASRLLKQASQSITERLGAPARRKDYCISQVVSSSEIAFSMRMEGYYYNQRAREAHAWATDHENGFWNLGDIADVYDVPPFKHIYVDEEYGVPFFTSGDLFKLERKPEKYLSTTQTKNLGKYILGRNWVLLARSGQLGGIIGRPQFSDSSLEGSATSDHVLRIVSEVDAAPPGYIYAYLATQEIGYHLLTRTSCGTSIPALWPKHLKSLPVVRAEPDFMKLIDQDVKNAFEIRVRATQLEVDARALIERAIEEGGR